MTRYIFKARGTLRPSNSQSAAERTRAARAAIVGLDIYTMQPLADALRQLGLDPFVPDSPRAVPNAVKLARRAGVVFIRKDLFVLDDGWAVYATLLARHGTNAFFIGHADELCFVQNALKYDDLADEKKLEQWLKSILV